MNYADTNWLEAVYITPHLDDAEAQERERIVERFARYAWKTQLGTFDAAVVASAKLAGGTRFLSFDTRAKALAAAEGLEVFPPLNADGKRILAELKR